MRKMEMEGAEDSMWPVPKLTLVQRFNPDECTECDDRAMDLRKDDKVTFSRHRNDFVEKESSVEVTRLPYHPDHGYFLTC